MKKNKKNTLGDIAQFISTGKTPPTKNDEYFKPEINWFTPGDFKGQKYLTSSSRKISNKAITDKKGILFPSGTILITCIGNIGNVGILETSSACNQQITALMPKPSITAEFLYYWLIKHKYLLENKTNNAVVPILNNKNLKSVRINYIPSIPEQKHIVNILDKAQALKINIQAELEDYQKMRKSLFLEMFGDIYSNIKYPIVTVGEIIQFVKDGPHVSPKYADEGVPILSTRNIRPFELLVKELKYVSQETYQTLTKRFKPKKDDVLITKGGTTGFAKIVDWDWDFCIWVHLAAMRVNEEKVLAKYLEAALNTYYCYQQSQRFTRGIANKDLGLKRMVNIKLPLAPLEKQQKFSEITRNIDLQKQMLENQLKEAEDIFQKLLQMAFKGELTKKPIIPNDSSDGLSEENNNGEHQTSDLIGNEDKTITQTEERSKEEVKEAILNLFLKKNKLLYSEILDLLKAKSEINISEKEYKSYIGEIFNELINPDINKPKLSQIIDGEDNDGLLSLDAKVAFILNKTS